MIYWSCRCRLHAGKKLEKQLNYPTLIVTRTKTRRKTNIDGSVGEALQDGLLFYPLYTIVYLSEATGSDDSRLTPTCDLLYV